MKVKTSITLSEDLVASIDDQPGGKGNRSGFIETVLRDFFQRKALEKQNLQDLEVINQNSKRLNEEANDVLDYQVFP